MNKLIAGVTAVALQLLFVVSAGAVCPTGGPALNSPGDGSEINAGLIAFKWDPVVGATPSTTYNLLVRFAGDTVFTSKGTTSSTSKTLNVEPGYTIEWKVEANTPSCAGVTSAMRSFSTKCPTNAPSTKSPSRGSSIPAGTKVKFQWSAVAGAAGYDVKVTPDYGANWTVIGANVQGTSYEQALPEGDWGWEVRANFNGSCNPLYSEPNQFFVVACNTAAPALKSPAAGATGVKNPVEFRWDPVTDATKYRVYGTIDGGAAQLFGTTTDTKLITTLSGTTITWAVEAVFDTCPAQRSAWRKFTLGGAACPNLKADLTSPDDGASGLASPVTFKWASVSGAKSYRVLASFGSGDAISLGSTTGTSLTADVPAGTGRWLVQTIFDEGCATTLSAARTLTVTTGAACDKAPPVPLSPNAGAVTSSPVEFRWSPSSGAVAYALWVASGDGDFNFYGETDGTSVERLVPAGVVRWYVVAKFAACPDAKSAVASFEVKAEESSCPTGAIALATPADGAAVDSPVRLSWSALAGAEAYRIWVSIAGAAPVALVRTTTTSADVSLPAGEIRWFVEGLRGGCSPVISDRRRFEVKQRTNCAGNQPPVLTSPVGSQEAPAELRWSRVTLTWTPAAGAIGYRVWLARDGQPFGDVALTRITSAELELDPADYAWYVEALFEGCPSVDSQRAYFEVEPTEERCGTTPPAVITPAPGATSGSPVTFSWTEVAAAEQYRVLIARDGQAPILLGTTPDRQLRRPLPPGQYEWSVEAVFASCASLASPRSHFKVDGSQTCAGDAPALLSPADESTTSDPEVTFSWTPVSGAERYVLFLEVNEGAETAVASTEKTSVTRVVPAGEIEWRVVAIVPGCEPGRSEESEVYVEPSSSCRNPKPILLAPRDRQVPSPVRFSWTPTPGATGYRVWAWQGEDDPAMIATATGDGATVALAPGSYHWFVEATFASCPPERSAVAEFTAGAAVACGTPLRPVANVVGRVSSGTTYRLRWNALPNTALYEVQESSTPDFSDAETVTTSGISLPFRHDVTSAPRQYLYRVRGISECNDAIGPYSDLVGVIVFPAEGSASSAEAGSGDPVVQKLFLPGGASPLQFTASADKPWVTVTPSSGTLPVDGLTLTVTADAGVLALGTNTFTVHVQYTNASRGGAAAEGSTVATIPMSVSLVTPVTPGGKGTPPPDALIFPAVAHVSGANESFFESDVRLTNLTAEVMKFDAWFTPSGTDGTLNGSFSTLEVSPGETIALDDILSSFFGEGTSAAAFGTLELRPVTTSADTTGGFFSSVVSGAIRKLDAAASSRTYNFTPAGTYGQFIPAIRFEDFVGGASDGQPAPVLLLQQVAQSEAFRANFGFVEGSGNPVDLQVRVFDAANTLLTTIPVSLLASEHRQIDRMLAVNGINDLADGRVEVEVVGGTGKVTAYVSEIDNRTNDPLMVSAEPVGGVTSSRYVVPGAGYVNNGMAFWVTDLRVFNAGTASTPVTLTFYPMTDASAAVTREIVLDAGEIEVIDNVLGDLFAQPNGAAGSIAITTPQASRLHASARTYNRTANGTYGQYIPAVTPEQSVGLADRALQILQLENSSRFRTNVGIVETSGQPVTVQVTAWVPDSIASPMVTFDLAANQFFQFPLSYFNLGDAVYNARVSVKVIAGDGRVTAYGSSIDQITQDPTYVPAQ